MGTLGRHDNDTIASHSVPSLEKNPPLFLGNIKTLVLKGRVTRPRDKPPPRPSLLPGPTDTRKLHAVSPWADSGVDQAYPPGSQGREGSDNGAGLFLKL